MAQGSRQSAIRALINVWLKLPTKVCATCDTEYYGGPIECCDMPVISNNQAAFRQFMRELKDVRLSRANNFASNKDKTLRLGLSIPSNLYLFLNTSMRRLYNEKLISEEFDMFWFMRHFPEFQVPEKI